MPSHPLPLHSSMIQNNQLNPFLETNPLPFTVPDIVKLNISLNKLSTWPEFIPQSIQVLDLRFNRLAHVPKLGEKLPNLKRLDLCGNRLVQFPEGLPICLEDLNVSGIRNLSEITRIHTLVNLKVLNMSMCRLNVFPDRLPQSLENLNLSMNIISLIPDNLSKRFPNLVLFEMSNNRLDKVPQNLPPSLRFLLLKNNNINVFPNVRSHLTNLVEINLCGNNLGDISYDYFPKHLLKLNVKDNSSVTIPNSCSISKLFPNLQILEFQGETILSGLPDSLNFVHFTQNNSRTVISPILNFHLPSKLQKLSIKGLVRGSNFTNENMWELIPSCLKMLKITNSRIPFPISIKHLQNLRSLTLFNFKSPGILLTQFPTSLENIRLFETFIESSDEFFLDSILFPNMVSFSFQLRDDCDTEVLSNITRIPTIFSSHLEILEISHCKIKSLDNLSNLYPNLIDLHLHHNMIEYLPGNLPIGLINANFSSNKIVTVSEQFLPNLKFLDLSNNLISTLPLELFSGLYKDIELQMIGNPLTDLKTLLFLETQGIYLGY